MDLTRNQPKIKINGEVYDVLNFNWIYGELSHITFGKFGKGNEVKVAFCNHFNDGWHDVDGNELVVELVKEDGVHAS